MDSNNNNAPKKTSSRKKLVDLKAVAALLEDSEGEREEESKSKKKEEAQKTTVEPNEELIQATARIKNQRDLIRTRTKKMEQSKDRVSKNVFDKVNRDYAMQLETINKLLSEKKTLLEAELKNLYVLREKQDIDINRHKEILEEARFRHFLEEYSEEQYKEVEEYESKEILNLQSELSQIQSYIKTHEELFDPEDLGIKPQPPAPPPSKKEVTKTVVRPQTPPPAAKKPAEEWAEKTPLPETPVKKEVPAAVKAPAVEEAAPEEPTAAEPVVEETSDSRIKPSEEPGESGELLLTPEEGDYFEAEEAAEPSISRGEPTEPATEPPEAPEEAEATDTRIKAEKAGQAPAEAKKVEKEPESILDVLEDIPLESEVSATEPKATPEAAAPAPEPQAAPAAYKLMMIEGETETPEIELKDNISIGRSPSNDIVLKAPKVSRQHAAINKYKDQFIIIDLKSSNGVFVNGKKVDEATLKEGDQISIGGYKMVVQKG